MRGFVERCVVLSQFCTSVRRDELTLLLGWLQVVSWVPGTDKDSALWHIRYDNGDEEYMKEQEMLHGIKLFHESQDSPARTRGRGKKRDRQAGQENQTKACGSERRMTGGKRRCKKASPDTGANGILAGEAGPTESQAGIFEALKLSSGLEVRSAWNLDSRCSFQVEVKRDCSAALAKGDQLTVLAEMSTASECKFDVLKTSHGRSDAVDQPLPIHSKLACLFSLSTASPTVVQDLNRTAAWFLGDSSAQVGSTRCVIESDGTEVSPGSMRRALDLRSSTAVASMFATHSKLVGFVLDCSEERKGGGHESRRRRRRRRRSSSSSSASASAAAASSEPTGAESMVEIEAVSGNGCAVTLKINGRAPPEGTMLWTHLSVLGLLRQVGQLFHSSSR